MRQPVSMPLYETLLVAWSVKIRNIPLTQETSWLLSVSHEKGPTVPYLHLSGTDKDGNSFDSPYIFLDGVGTRSTPNKAELTLRAGAAALDVRRGEEVDLQVSASGAIVRYHTSGMMGFRVVSSESP